MKFKVMVIDDKPLIRQSIVKTIDWGRMDCEVVGEAENGTEGKRMITELRPDIIITDIKMPGLNGLEVAEFVKAWLPRAKIILITGYQEFELARRALRLGVHEMLLKPLSNDEIYKAVGIAVRRLRSEYEEEYETLEGMRAKWVFNCIQNPGRQSPEAFRRDAWKLGLTCERYVMAAVRIKNKPAGEVQTCFSRVGEAAKTLEETYGVRVVGVQVQKELVLILLFQEAISENDAYKVMKICFARVGEALDGCPDLDYSVAASSLYDDWLRANVAYGEAMRILDIHFFNGKIRFLFPDNRPDGKDRERSAILDDLQQFYGSLEHGGEEEVDRKLDALLGKIHLYSIGNILVAKGLISEVCITVARQFHKKTGNERRAPKEIDELLLDIDRLQDANEAAAYIHDYICQIRLGLTWQAPNTHPLVRRAIETIHASYAKNITLENLADKFGIHPSSLSRLLKRETGKNFVDILSGARIDAAKRLLSAPDAKISDVAEQVGYKDYTYFYQVFKKSEGISPNEYKRSAL